MTRLFIGMALLTSGVVTQAQPAYLVRDNPDQLAYVAFTDSDCEVEQDELEETVQGVLVRSRIKPIKWPQGDEDFRLSVDITCLESKTAFDVDVDFMDAINFRHYRHGPVGYGSFGTFHGNKDFLLNSVEGSVEEALTEYLEANFDLSPE